MSSAGGCWRRRSLSPEGTDGHRHKDGRPQTLAAHRRRSPRHPSGWFGGTPLQSRDRKGAVAPHDFTVCWFSVNRRGIAGPRRSDTALRAGIFKACRIYRPIGLDSSSAGKVRFFGALGSFSREKFYSWLNAVHRAAKTVMTEPSRTSAAHSLVSRDPKQLEPCLPGVKCSIDELTAASINSFSNGHRFDFRLVLSLHFATNDSRCSNGRSALLHRLSK